MNRHIISRGNTVGHAAAAGPVFYQMTKDGSSGWYFTDQRGALYGPFASQGSAEHVYAELQTWYRTSGRTVQTS